MILTDTVTLDASSVRRTRDGYLVADVRAARTGVQTYTGADVGKPEMRTVNVYRPEDEVFKADSLASYGHRPVTLGHPDRAVVASNWKDLAVGQLGGDVVRDGQFVRVPMAVMDQRAIDAVDAGTREVSMGYECELEFVDGVAPDGTAYQAIQRNLRMNHAAIVPLARGGPALRIGDNAVPNLKTITYDGLQVVEVSDAAEALINKLTGQLATVTAAKDAAEAQVATLTTASATKDAEIVTLKQAVEDSKVTPAQLRDAAKAYATTLAQAKVLAPTLTIGDDMDAPAVKKAVVAAKLGDAAKDWTDAQVDVSFATMAAGVKLEDAKDPLAAVISAGVTSVSDAEKAASDAYAKMVADMKGEKAAA